MWNSFILLNIFKNSAKCHSKYIAKCIVIYWFCLASSEGEVTCMQQSAEFCTFRQDLRCARRNFFCSILSILNSLLKISGVQVPCSAHQDADSTVFFREVFSSTRLESLKTAWGIFMQGCKWRR